MGLPNKLAVYGLTSSTVIGEIKTLIKPNSQNTYCGKTEQPVESQATMLHNLDNSNGSHPSFRVF